MIAGGENDPPVRMQAVEFASGARLRARLAHHAVDIANAERRLQVIRKGARVEDRARAGKAQPEAEFDVFPPVLAKRLREEADGVEPRARHRDVGGPEEVAA